jgi:ComF family protein
MYKPFSYLYHVVSSLVYPSYCRSCSVMIDDSRALCDECFKKITFPASLIIAVTPSVPLKVYAVGLYQEPLRSLILRKKSWDVSVFRSLAHLMLQTLPFDSIKGDLLVPVPLHWTRYAYRGYNQSDLLASTLSKALLLAVEPCVKRVVRTPFQSLLRKKERMENVKDAFSLKGVSGSLREKIEGKHVVLVDDLCTTGATLKNVAKVFLPYKPARISAVVVCRAF